ncbi:Tetratricopeptide repeat-containing domain [Phytophthora cactorum]|nr:Tetratricopeptide repeat-containing domain [Phytophthora cactorum]
MLGIRRALLRSSGHPLLASRGFPSTVNHLGTATASRGFATAASDPETPSKWPKQQLITALDADATYLLQGDFDLATKYYSKSFKVIKNFLSPIDIYAALCEELKRYEAALPYYQTAMKNLKDVNPISDRYVERLNLLGCTAHCYHQIGRHETADKFKQAISLYEKYRGEFSVSSSSGSNGRVVGKLDGVIVIMFLHYAQLLAAMERGNEVTDMRQSLTQIVGGFYVSKKAVKMTLVLGAALTGALLYLERENADRKKIRYLLELGQLSLEKGDIEQSMREREKAYHLLKRKFPQGLRVLMLDRLGQCYKQTGDPEAAVEHFKQAIEATS